MMKLEDAARKAIALDNRIAALDAERALVKAAHREAIRDWCAANGYFAGMTDERAMMAIRRELENGKA